MRLEYQILIAVAIDLVLGDPPWLPHPFAASVGWPRGSKRSRAAGSDQLGWQEQSPRFPFM